MLEKVEQLFTELLKAIEIRKIDYKREQYRLDTNHNKSLFIKDILCITNAPGGDGHILLGVKSEKGKLSEVVGVSKHHDSSDLEQLVNSKITEPIHFEYYRLKYKGLDCALIHIPQSKSRPHWLKEGFGILKQYVFYTRRASGNRPASIPEIREMFLSSIPISDLAHRKARATGHFADEWKDMSSDDRKAAMYKTLKSTASKLHLTKYYPLTAAYVTGEAGALVTDKNKKSVNDYYIFMYPWTAKKDDVIRTHWRIESFIKGPQSTQFRPLIRRRLGGSALVHISYKNICTKALEQGYDTRLDMLYKFANAWNEPWGTIIKWEANIPIITEHPSKKKFTTTYQKKEQYEFFIPNVTSKAELQDCLEKLIAWVRCR